jgi:hypothetical protein
MQGTRLIAVGDEEQPGERLGLSVTREPRVEAALTGLLLTTLKTISQKTLVALAALVDLALIASVFALCLMIVTQPSPAQLIEAAGYAAFVLTSIYIRRR